MGGFVKMDGRKDYRVEMDSVGAKDVPENVYYGVQSFGQQRIFILQD